MRRKEFVWTSGEDRENVTHYVKLRIFMYEVRGIVGIDVLTDNKLQSPLYMRAQFGLQAEIGQMDKLTKKLDAFIQQKITVIEAL
ncbi:hypothetical protein [Bacillus sp. CGMCC 1.16541]|uniref:hypothetical protein n=1 Tax=Bacillus sp. CGMCC 1.16541 TaxID=2185143 RepID=UPI000D7359F0|nr:hypothetical protein [Bacillus sp. CGMCC 1.16541]